MQSTDPEAWLAANTAKCPLGRMTRRQCEVNRSRPTPAEHFRTVPGRHISLNKATNIVFRPGACSECKGWDHFKGKNTGMAKIVKCAECGEEKEHLAKGLCKQCYWKMAEAKQAAKKKAAQGEGSQALSTDGKPATVPDGAAESKRNGSENKPPKRSKPAGGGQKIVIDFADCPELLNELRKVARNEDRTPEQQARYAVRCHLAMMVVQSIEHQAKEESR